MRTLIHEMIATTTFITEHLKQLAIKSAEFDRTRFREASVIISSDEEETPEKEEESNDLELENIK